MIKIQDSVPNIYYDSSRDFQLIGHLFDLVLNAVKTDADLVFNLPISTNSDDQLLDLMTYTFGLQLDKTRYTSKQLRALCSVAPQMLRAKGSVKAVRLLCTALMHADGLEDLFTLTPSADNTQLTISLSPLASCKEIILEILPYILPAGMVFNIISTGLSSATSHSEIDLQDSVVICNVEPPATAQPLTHPTSSILSDYRDAGVFGSDTTGASLVLNSKLAPNAVLIKPEPIKEDQ